MALPNAGAARSALNAGNPATIKEGQSPSRTAAAVTARGGSNGTTALHEQSPEVPLATNSFGDPKLQVRTLRQGNGHIVRRHGRARVLLILPYNQPKLTVQYKKEDVR
jgi:hypothetical protein